MLRIGVVLDSYTSSAWIAKVIEDIQASAFARVELVIVGDSSQGRGSVTAAPGERRKFLLLDFYERWDYRRNKAKYDAMASIDLSSQLSGIPSISTDSVRGDSAVNIPDDQLAGIRNQQLDVILCCSARPLRGAMLSVARYGIWSFHHGEGSGNGSEAPLLQEMLARDPVSRSTLQMLTGSNEGSRVLYESYASTDQLSLYGTRNPIYWKTAEFALRRLHDLHTRGKEYIDALTTQREAAGAVTKRRGEPNNLEMALFMTRYITRWIQTRVARLGSGSRIKWYIGIRPRSADYPFDDTSNYKLLPCPDDRFYADPFLIEKDGKTFLFFEDFRYTEGRALLSCCELERDGTPGEPFEVLRRPYHLSYPFVFEYGGEMYMIPETKENRQVELYRGENFPTTWVSEAVLVSDIYAVDATVQKINGKFWMFAGVSNGRYSNSDELCLFYSDALTGPWTAHPSNPVLSDVRKSRPAGAMFYDEGRLIRPSQDCGKAYGYALVFSEVLTLTETEYEERPISRVEPDTVAGCVGTHTYNRTEQFEVVDRTLTGM